MGALEDKVIVITGASRGLGEAMALGFAREGAALVLGARTVDDLDRVAAACRAAGARGVATVECDVRKQDQVQRLVDEALTTFGRLDVFVANAATSPANVRPGHRFGDITTYDLDTWRTIIDTNITGQWRCWKAAAPVMTPGSSFVFIGSGTGRRATGGNSVYGTSKAGVDALTRVCSAEGKRLGIRVNCLSPGGMTDTFLFGPGKMPEALKRLPGGYLEPEVIVPAAVWLASDASRDVTGMFFSAKEFNAWGVEETLKQAAAGHIPM